MNNELLEKPKFFDGISAKIILVIELICSVIPLLFPNISGKYINLKLSPVILIFIASFIIIIIFYVIKYIYIVNKFYKKYAVQFENFKKYKILEKEIEELKKNQLQFETVDKW